jgi:hypothetical protein
MARRLLAGLLTATLTASLLVFGSAAPAVAQSGGGCAIGPPISVLEVYHEPRMFHYRVLHNGNKNNVNFKLFDAAGQLRWSWNSPDDRVGLTWYHIQPAVVVPPGGTVHVTAIFDVFGPDPQCTYGAQPCCSLTNGWSPNGSSGLWGVSPPYITHPSTLQVNAELPGHTSFVFVVKSAGLADAYFHNQPSTFQIPFSYAGRTVQVSARAAGPVSNPWAFPELSFFFPPFG